MKRMLIIKSNGTLMQNSTLTCFTKHITNYSAHFSPTIKTVSRFKQSSGKILNCYSEIADYLG